MPTSLLDNIWAAHELAPGLLYIDLHLVHEVTSPQAFDGLRLAGRNVRRPDRTLASADHNTPTAPASDGARRAGRNVRRADRTLATADHNQPTDGKPTAARIKDVLSREQV